MMDIEINAACPFEGKQVLILAPAAPCKAYCNPFWKTARPGAYCQSHRQACRSSGTALRYRHFDHRQRLGRHSLPTRRLRHHYQRHLGQLEGKLPPVNGDVVGADSLVYDMMYGTEPTVFMDWAKDLQPECRTRDGLACWSARRPKRFIYGEASARKPPALSTKCDA